MAIIYGRPDSEIEILRRSPRTVEKFEDISIEHQKLKDGLAEEKKVFCIYKPAHWPDLELVTVLSPLIVIISITSP